MLLVSMWFVFNKFCRNYDSVLKHQNVNKEHKTWICWRNQIHIQSASSNTCLLDIKISLINSAYSSQTHLLWCIWSNGCSWYPSECKGAMRTQRKYKQIEHRTFQCCRTEDWFDINMPFYQYLRNGISFAGRTTSQIARFMGPTWGPPGSCRPQMGPCWPHEPCYQGSLYRIRALVCIAKQTQSKNEKSWLLRH